MFKPLSMHIYNLAESCFKSATVHAFKIFANSCKSLDTGPLTAEFNIDAPYANISRLKFRIISYSSKLIEPSDRGHC